MRDKLPPKVEAGRVREGYYASDASEPLAQGWEHVSVSTAKATPNWLEMSWIKDQFWTEDECVVQFHPPRADYVNNHQYCLHLWRCVTAEMPRPPAILVGVAKLGVLA